MWYGCLWIACCGVLLLVYLWFAFGGWCCLILGVLADLGLDFCFDLIFGFLLLT